MNILPVRIASLAVELPARLLTNQHFRDRFPEQVRKIEDNAMARLWRPVTDQIHPFDEAMKPYLNDPFRGVVERRWLADGEQSVELEERAARRALGTGSVDAIYNAAFFPDQVDVGNGAFLARRLGFGGPSVNIESACSSGLIALITAASMIAAGVYQRVLVVTSCNYSRLNPEADTLSWGNGDGAAALVLERSTSGGLLGTSIRSTHETCGSVVSTMVVENGQPVIRMRAEKQASQMLRDASEKMAVECVGAALDAAGIKTRDLDAVAANCPTAWYSAFLSQVFSLPESKIENIHPKTANIGPVLFLVALAQALEKGRVSAETKTLFYTIGSVSNAAAAVYQHSGPPIVLA